MNVTHVSSRPNVAKWSWGILLVVSALLVLNGVALYFISASPTTFEQDTGVSMAAVRQAFPTVADHVVREGQIISVLLASMGLMAVVVALEGYRVGNVDSGRYVGFLRIWVPCIRRSSRHWGLLPAPGSRHVGGPTAGAHRAVFK